MFTPKNLPSIYSGKKTTLLGEGGFSLKPQFHQTTTTTTNNHEITHESTTTTTSFFINLLQTQSKPIYTFQACKLNINNTINM